MTRRRKYFIGVSGSAESGGEKRGPVNATSGAVNVFLDHRYVFFAGTVVGTVGLGTRFASGSSSEELSSDTDADDKS